MDSIPDTKRYRLTPIPLYPAYAGFYALSGDVAWFDSTQGQTTYPAYAGFNLGEREMTLSEYIQEIKSLATDIIAESADSDVYMTDMVDEYVDAHQWIIYSCHNIDVLKHSKNADYACSMGLLGEVSHWDRLLTVSAYYAMRADIIDVMQDICIGA